MKLHLDYALIMLIWQEIYKTGGRKFAFLNVPPIGCMPILGIQTIDGNCQSESLVYIRKHNEALLQALMQLEKQLPGFKCSLYDFYSAVQQRIDDPSKYGTYPSPVFFWQNDLI